MIKKKVKVKWSCYRPGVAQRVGRGIVLLFHDRGTLRPHFTPGKDEVTILQEAGWAPGPVWTGGKSRPHRDSISNCTARSQSLYWMSYRCSKLVLHKYSGVLPYTTVECLLDGVSGTVIATGDSRHAVRLQLATSVENVIKVSFFVTGVPEPYLKYSWASFRKILVCQLRIVLTLDIWLEAVRFRWNATRQRGRIG